MAPTASTNGHAPPSRFPDTQNVISFFLSILDRIASPQTRQRAYSAAFQFCYHRPVLSSFLVVQLLFALLPLLCFIGFSVCVILFATAVALGAGILCVGTAAVILFWALVIAFTLAASTWVYLACCFICIRWIARVSGYLETPPATTKPQTASSSSSGASQQQKHPSTATTGSEKQEQSSRGHSYPSTG
ncbi:hypothetical protein TWF696_005564 [Orbilia brochopaga]|uniref:Uncharacterized protein n=1 Tax=Orbilia brochopaga TaxID=3140254 RepID=A0AAV9V195_9PEZI